MGFKSNINYAAYEGLRQGGAGELTKAKWLKKKEEEAEAKRLAAEAKAAATRRSGQRSALHKLGSAAIRAGVAYGTSGASEALGFGGTIDDIVLGRDDQGNPVRNEYGELVRAGSGIYGAMKAKKASDVARKRESNISDYNEQVALAKEMGVLDPVLGKNMLQEARDTRYAQKAQTQAAEDAGVIGWDNDFDDLGLTPTQIKGAEIAQAKQDADNESMNVKERAQGASLGRRIDYNASQDAEKRERLNKIIRANAESKIDELEQAPTMSEVEAMWERDRKASDLANIREDAMRGDAIREGAKEYRARLNAEKPESILIDELIDERSAEKRLDYDPALERTTVKFKGSPISKTYLEKAALESDRDFNAKDKISDQLDEAKLLKKAKDSKYNQLIEAGYGSGFIPQSLRDPRIVEAELMLRKMEDDARKRRQKEIERMSFRSGEQYNPYESPLLKRMRAKRKAQAEGSILHS
jgi:hypothetical protein